MPLMHGSRIRSPHPSATAIPDAVARRAVRLARQVAGETTAWLAIRTDDDAWTVVAAAEADEAAVTPFCTATATHGPILASDVAADERFATSVTESDVRFFAGVPLRTADETVGVLGVADGAPCSVDAAVLEGLQDVAKMAEDAIGQQASLAPTADTPDQQRALLQQTQRLAGAWCADLDEGVIWMTSAACRIHGLDPEATLSVDEGLRFYPPAAQEALQAACTQGNGTGASFDLELSFGAAEDDRWVRVTGAPVRRGGTVTQVVGAIQEITAQRQAQQALRRERDLLTRIFDTSAAAITVLDTEGTILRANERAEEMLDLAPSCVDGRVYDDPIWRYTTVDGAPLPDDEQPFVQMMATEAPVQDVRHAIERPDGRRRILSVNGAPLRDADGTVTGGVFLIDDVTEMHEQRQALEEERARLEMALRGGELGLWDLNFNTGRNVVDARWAEMLGYTLDEVGTQQAFFERHTHPEDLERAYDAMARHARGDLPYVDVEIRMQAKDGTWRWILDRGKILEWNDDGSPRRAVGTHLDITERKAAEEALRTSKIALEQAQAITQTGNGVWDLTQNTFTLSDEAGRLLGLDADATHPLDRFFERVHPDDRALLRNEFERLKWGGNHDAEYRVRPADDDTVRWVQGRGRPETDADGTITKVLGTITDVSDRREAERALRQSEERFRAVSEQAVDVVAIFNADGTFAYLSPSVEEVTGHPREVLEGTDGFAPVHPDDRSALRAAFTAALQDANETVEVEGRYRHRDGTWRHLSIRGRQLAAGRKKPQVLANVRDITEQKRRREALVDAKEAAEEANRLKSAFLANMSHEIRTPLTAIIGFIELLDDMEHEPPADTFIDHIYRSSHRLLKTLTSVLDLSQLEAGSMTLRREPITLRSFVRETTNDFRAKAKVADVALDVEAPPHPVTTSADEGALRSIVNNLVGNAIKFTEAGGQVVVRVRATDGAAVLEVEDTGVGIDPAFLPHIFDPFKQESGGNTREYQGTGLGMAITKRLVELMDGSIEIDSEKGVGTRMTVRLPRRPASEAPPGEALGQ
jgi:PAS domain S-box-containing protein